MLWHLRGRVIQYSKVVGQAVLFEELVVYTFGHRERFFPAPRRMTKFAKGTETPSTALAPVFFFERGAPIGKGRNWLFSHAYPSLSAIARSGLD